MILVIDNYDSFTYNLVQYLGELGADVRVRRNDQVTIGEVEAMSPEQILISPGPGRPENAGITTDVIRRFGPKTPILGVCLGHQAIGEAFGGAIVRGGVPVHGKVTELRHRGFGVVLSEGGPTLFGQLLAAGAVDDLFLTVAPQVAGRSGQTERLSLVEGMGFAPSQAPWARLRSVMRSEDYLFLRYDLSGRDREGLS